MRLLQDGVIVNYPVKPGGDGRVRKFKTVDDLYGRTIDQQWDDR